MNISNKNRLVHFHSQSLGAVRFLFYFSGIFGWYFTSVQKIIKHIHNITCIRSSDMKWTEKVWHQCVCCVYGMKEKEEKNSNNYENFVNMPSTVDPITFLSSNANKKLYSTPASTLTFSVSIYMCLCVFTLCSMMIFYVEAIVVFVLFVYCRKMYRVWW